MKNIRSLCFLLVWLLCSPLVLAADTVIRIGVEHDSAPLSYVDDQGNPVGFSAELLAAMTKASGVEIEIVPGYWTQILKQFKAGELDALANVTITEERREWMDFSISHAYVHGLVYFPEGNPRIRHTSDFVGKTVGALKGSIGYNNAMAYDGWGATIVPFETREAALDAARIGETDASIFIRRLAKTPWLEAQGMEWEFVDDIVHEYHFAVHKGDARTLERLNEALATIRGNGTFDRIYAKWIGPLEPHPIRWADLRPYYLPAASVLIVVVGFIIWQRRMMNRLEKQKEALRKSEERWKFAVEGAGDGVWDWNAITNRVLLSRRWLEVLGYNESKDRNPRLENWLKFAHPDDYPVIRAVWDAAKKGERDTFTYEHRLLCADGGWKWMLNRGMVISRDNDGAPLRVLGTHTDITALKQAEEDRLVLGKLESTGVLAGGIAHDFNNLLTAIILNLELARYNRGSMDELIGYVKSAEKAALSARGLTQQLITFAKGGSTVVGLNDIRKLLEDAVPLVLSGSNVRADMLIAEDLWSAVVDAGQIGQVIRNLVLNAREAMPGGGVIRVAAENVVLKEGEVRGLDAGEYLKIEVSDEGEGIAPENLSRIFDPYFSTKQRGPQKGMGLGLTICHSIILKHRGMLMAESQPDEGTSFVIYLPATPNKKSKEAFSVPPFPPKAKVSRRIMIMDDEEIMRDTLSRTLQEMGYEVESFPDGESAVRGYEELMDHGEKWDVVLLDLTIPGGMGGRETMEVLRDMDPDIRGVLMTGYTNDEIMNGYAEAGFNAVLPKPFTAEGLRQVLAEVYSV